MHRFDKSLLPSTLLITAGFAIGTMPLWAQSQPTVDVRCKVVDDIRHEPIARVRLVLSGSKLLDPLVMDTTEDGACAFQNVPPGKYTLSFQKAGYFPPDAGVAVDATVPPKVDLGTITLIRWRTISGVVRWDNEERADHVLVHALLVKRGRAAMKMGDVFITGTNGAGEFRLDKLKPGRYVVYTYVPGLAPAFLKPRVALPVYYPNSPIPDVGASIDVTNREEVSDLLMHLKEMKEGVPVEGFVEATAEFPKGSIVNLGLTIEGSPAQAITGVEARAGEPFRINPVPSGSYRFVAVPKGRQFESLRDFQPLHVGAEPVTGVKISLRKRPSLDGTAEIVSSQAGAQTSQRTPAAKVNVLASSEALQLYGGSHDTSDEKGEFHLENVAEGETFLLNLTPPAGTYIARVEQDARTVSGGPFPVVGGGGPIHIELRDDGGIIQGSVKKRDGVAGNGFVVLAPVERGREHLFKTAAAADDGSFLIQDIAPGDYDLFAFNRNEEDLYFEPPYLASFVSGSTRITVGAKEARRQDLDIIDVTSRRR
jgi:hypothetical protein